MNNILFDNQFTATNSVTSVDYQAVHDLPLEKVLGDFKIPETISFTFKSKILDTSEFQTITAIPIRENFTYVIRVIGVAIGKKDPTLDDVSSYFNISRTCFIKGGQAFLKSGLDSYKDENSKIPSCDVRAMTDCFAIYCYGSILGGSIMGQVTVMVCPNP